MKSKVMHNKILHEYINGAINRYFRELLGENKIITFNGEKVYPNFGWCVILAGGSGSGKGFTLRNELPIDGKLFNVDAYKKLYVVGQKYGYINDPKDYDLKDDFDVSDLHNKIKGKRWKQIERNNFFNKGAKINGRLPNVIFDITAKNLNDIEEIINYAKPLGYKIMFIWTVTNRSVALFRNLTRSRVISQDIFHKIHNACNSFIPSFLKGSENEIVNEIDVAWLSFGSGATLKENEIENPCIRLIKSDNGFKFPVGVEKQLMGVLGPQEENPLKPTTYLGNNEIRKKIYSLNGKNSGKKIWKTDEIDFIRH